MLPRPAESFQIPSLHDSLPLECRICYPSRQFRGSCLKAAIIAHPYAPLGGSYDDPVVGVIGRTLLSYGYIVFTFNFRYLNFPVTLRLVTSNSAKRSTRLRRSNVMDCEA